jgi:hypothetical protein
MNVPMEWILASIGGLASVISILAGVIYRALSNEISTLRQVVTKLQDDVDRLSKGCGLGVCLWKNR